MRTARWAATLAIGSTLVFGCGAGESVFSEESVACSSSVTQNSYDGPNYWGTITVKNSGTASWSGFAVSFDVPSGAHCTNDAVPSGATLSPLTGSGSSAHTTSNHCVFTWTTSLASGKSKTFNYSADSTSFSAASNVQAKSASCGGGGGGGGADGGGTGGSDGGGTGGSDGGGTGGSDGGGTGGNFTAAQILAAIQLHMTSSDQVNTKPHINTMTRAANVNVYQVTSGVYAYASSMAVDTDGSDPDPDPDHQSQTTWTDADGKSLGAHHVPYYVLGDYCYDKVAPCPHFYYAEHHITGLQFALVFYGGKVIGAVFGDTQGDSVTPTSDNDSRELGEASVEAASLLGIPSSGTTGGVDSGVTVVIFSGAQWVVHGTNSTLNANAQALVQQALNTLGISFGL
jgi:hypothetical protein